MHSIVPLRRSRVTRPPTKYQDYHCSQTQHQSSSTFSDYYLWRNADGFIENTTCVNNTDSEHNMVERLIIDDLFCWAVYYKIDGFRFDLMGHIMKLTMVHPSNMVLKCGHMMNSNFPNCNGMPRREGTGLGVLASSILTEDVGAKRALQDFSEDKNGVDGSNMAKDGTLVKLHTMDVDHPLQQGLLTGLSLEGSDVVLAETAPDLHPVPHFISYLTLLKSIELLQPNGHGHDTEAVEARMLAMSRDHIQVYHPNWLLHKNEGHHFVAKILGWLWIS
ncbi:hypothetical protein RJ641_036333 [Dillenia turbinata]|uniref:Uncharacterized protein n=1 Tax=Dillenia turbinata TaxID=194707 RepID=A0AAN8VKL9_9MAGN